MVQEAEKLKNNCPLSLVVNSITMRLIKVDWLKYIAPLSLFKRYFEWDHLWMEQVFLLGILLVKGQSDFLAMRFFKCADMNALIMGSILRPDEISGSKLLKGVVPIRLPVFHYWWFETFRTNFERIITQRLTLKMMSRMLQSSLLCCFFSASKNL